MKIIILPQRHQVLWEKVIQNSPVRIILDIEILVRVDQHL